MLFFSTIFNLYLPKYTFSNIYICKIEKINSFKKNLNRSYGRFVLVYSAKFFVESSRFLISSAWLTYAKVEFMPFHCHFPSVFLYKSWFSTIFFKYLSRYTFYRYTYEIWYLLDTNIRIFNFIFFKSRLCSYINIDFLQFSFYICQNIHFKNIYL